MNRLLWAACGVLLVVAGAGSCSSTPPKSSEEALAASARNLRQVLQTTIKDPATLEQMLAIVDRAAPQVRQGLAEFVKLQQEQKHLDAAYAATPEDFHRLYGRLDAARENYRVLVLDTRMALAALASDEEWKQIVSRDLPIVDVLGN